MTSSSELVHLVCPDHRTILADGIRSMMLDGFKTDLTIRGTAGHSIQAHQLVLSLFAPSFRQCFSTNSDKEMDLPKLSHLDQLLEFVYSGRLDVPRSRLGALLEAARRLGVDRLVRAIRASGCTVRQTHVGKKRRSVVTKTSTGNEDTPEAEVLGDHSDDTEVTTPLSGEDDSDLQPPVVTSRSMARRPSRGRRPRRAPARPVTDATTASATSSTLSSSSCPHCDYRAPGGKRRYLVVHLARVHRMDVCGQPLRERFPCGDCGATFFFGKDLGLHALTAHASEKPFRCSECSYATVHKGSLTIHVNIVHRNIRQYVCELCGHRSAHLSAFKCHLRSHTGEKPYQCATCQAAGKIKKYSDRYNYKLHLKKHENDEKGFLCHLCSHSTRRRDNLRSHLARVHNAELPS